MDRNYVVGFVAGSLVGLALGVPGGYALLRAPVRAAAPAPSAAIPRKAPLAVLIDEARQAARSGQPERALAKTLEAERLDPKSAVVKNNLCSYLNELRRYDEAIAACNAALRLDPDFTMARNNLSWARSAREKEGTATSSNAP
jgi:Flp pilus assembly protein TadD